MIDKSENNKNIVRSWTELAINQRKPEEAVAKYLGPHYRQHNPTASDGPQPFIDVIHNLSQAFPTIHLDVKRMVAEGDMVMVHSQLIRQPGDRGMAVVDIFRLENGKIVEHWDVVQEVPEHPANNNTMF
jgi:predicted SnoaL-like aldol condensation-catalyzing enzyme